jgi:hypothetical protein
VDEGAGGYGVNPPMQNVTILKGPQAPPGDGLDNNHNGVIDEANEWMGLSNFLYYVNTNSIPTGNPATEYSYISYMNSTWLDSIQCTYGGNGRDTGFGNTGVPTNFMFSGTPYDTSHWTMQSASFYPDDVRGVGSCGPFTIAAGETKSIDFAYIYTRDFNHPNGIATSIAKNTHDIQKIIHWFSIDSFPSCSITALPTMTKSIGEQIDVYPNPAKDEITISASFPVIGQTYEIIDAIGRVIRSGKLVSEKINVGNFSQGLYILEIVTNSKSYSRKFTKQ